MEGTEAGTQPQAIPLRINDKAPGFTARSTAGEISLASYRGRWVVFFSHPADFTSVCTSELIAFARAQDRFAALGCELLGLSIDSLYAHVAWLRDIQRVFGVGVAFPLVEDPSMAIARAYGMLDSSSASSATVRATYVIDPEGVIRAIIWYPMNVGRSVDEILRLVQALQVSRQECALTPEGWRPGAPLVEQAAASMAEAAMPEAPNATWYYRERVA